MSFKGTDQGRQAHFHLEDANMDTLIRIARGLGEKVTGVVEGPDWTTDGEARINAQEGLITTILARLSEIVTEMKEVNLISATPSDDSAQSPDTCGPCHTISDAHRRLDVLEATVAEMRAEADNCEAGMTGNEGNQPSSPETVQSGMTRECVSFHNALPTYTLRESVWDAAVWIGSVSRLDSLFVGMLLFMNAAVQLFFTILIFRNVGEIEDMNLANTDLEGFFSWRVSAAHDVKYYDDMTDTSLATRVCAGWDGLSRSFGQSQAYQSFEGYLGTNTDLGVAFAGPGLAALCLLCWFLLVGAEVLNTFDLSMALLSLSTSSTKSMFRISDGGEYACESVSIRRIILLHVFVILPRLAVATVLVIPGALFLVYTAEIPDLILNAVALGFVLDMDEVIFQFLPSVVRAVIPRTVSLPLKYQPRRFGVGVLVLVIFPAVAVVLSLLETQVVTRAQLAQDLICGGDTDFIFTTDPATGVVFAAPTSAVPDLDWESYAFRAVLQKTTLDTTAMQQYLEVTQDGIAWRPYDVQLSLIDTSENVEAIAAATAAEAFAALQCIDLDTSTAYLTRLRESKGNDSIQECSELLSSCQEAVSRMFCPHSCECDTTLTGLYIRDSCSSSCDELLLAELSAIDSSLFGVGETSAACASNYTSWMDTFLSQLQESLVSAGDVTKNGSAYVWSPLFMDKFDAVGRGGLCLERYCGRHKVDRHIGGRRRV